MINKKSPAKQKKRFEEGCAMMAARPKIDLRNQAVVGRNLEFLLSQSCPTRLLKQQDNGQSCTEDPLKKTTPIVIKIRRVNLNGIAFAFSMMSFSFCWPSGTGASFVGVSLSLVNTVNDNGLLCLVTIASSSACSVENSNFLSYWASNGRLSVTRVSIFSQILGEYFPLAEVMKRRYETL